MRRFALFSGFICVGIAFRFPSAGWEEVIDLGLIIAASWMISFAVFPKESD